MKSMTLKAFEMEKKRDVLAQNEQFDELKETYKASISHIPNLNTGKMWDVLNRKQITKTDNPMAFDRITEVTRLLKGTSIRVLDVGLGHGAVEEKLNSSEICSELLGIDISKESIMKLKKKYKRWKFIYGNILNTKVLSNHFDYVLALELLEHILPQDTFKVLNKLFKSLKHNGYLIISVPTNEGLKEMVTSGQNPNAHVRTYTLPLITAELKLTGFKIILTKFLYAFHNVYKIKSIIAKYTNIKKPNNIIILAQKP